jgi:hypothetical protein
MYSRITFKIAAIAAMALVGTGAATSSLAQSAPSGVIVEKSESTPAEHLLHDKWVVSAGTFILTSKLDGDLNGTANTTDRSIDFDHDFGTGASINVIRAGALWRFKPKHHLRLEYFHNRTTHTRTLDKDVAWGDYTFLANGQVSAKNEFSVYELSYEYAFLRRPDYEIAAAAGIHFVDSHLQISGNATVTNSDGTVRSASFQSKSSQLPAPLPVIGIHGGWAFAPNWHLDAAGQVFKVKIGAIDGNWWDLRTGVTWMYNRHVGLSAGYEKFITHVDVSKANFNGSLNLGYSGLLFNVTGVF